MYNVPNQCPTCSGNLQVREVSCPTCHTEIRGQWQPGAFDQLTAEQRTFLSLFVRSRGNLSEVERNLGVSYPTVRAKLEELIEVLEGPVQTVDAAPAYAPVSAIRELTREDILTLVAQGEITVDEGLARIQTLANRETSQ